MLFCLWSFFLPFSKASGDHTAVHVFPQWLSPATNPKSGLKWSFPPVIRILLRLYVCLNTQSVLSLINHFHCACFCSPHQTVIRLAVMSLTYIVSKIPRQNLGRLPVVSDSGGKLPDFCYVTSLSLFKVLHLIHRKFSLKIRGGRCGCFKF